MRGTHERIDRVSLLLESHFVGRPFDIPVGVGFCMLVPVAIVHEVGLLDPIFGRGYCEEVDWCLRAKEFGYRNVGRAERARGSLYGSGDGAGGGRRP